MIPGPGGGIARAIGSVAMTGWEIVTTAVLVLAVASIGVLLAVVVRLVRAAAERHAAAASEAEALRARLEELERRLVATPAAGQGAGAEEPFVITHMGEPGSGLAAVPESAPARVTLTPPAFADAVVRETVVQTAALVHGVRRALAPDVLNRIRFEMRRELKRSRKARKQEVREALREYRARRRAGSAA